MGGGDSDDGRILGGILGEDEPARRYTSPLVHVASPDLIDADNVFVFHANAIRRQGPLVRWEVQIEATCGEQRCEAQDALYEGTLPEDAGAIDFEHVFSDDVTMATVGLNVFYHADNSSDPVQARGVNRRIERALYEADGEIRFIHAPEDLAALEISSDGVFEGSLHIEGARGLRDLTALSGLRELRGSLTIASNPDLHSFDGLEQLERVEGTLFLRDNWSLEEATLPALQTAEDIALFGINGDDETPWHPFPALEQTTSLILEDTYGSRDIGGFHSLEHLEELELERTATLEHFSLGDHESLTHLGDVRLIHNFALRSFEVGASVRSIDSLNLTDNHSTPSLDGFSAVEWMQRMTIDNNYGLETLEGFERIKHLDHLTITYNPDLESLDGLDNLESVSQSFDVAGNPQMHFCEAHVLEIRTRGEDATARAVKSDCPR